jgi:hypothetical protein
MNPRVQQVHPNDDYTLTLKFSNGETRIYDMKPHLDSSHLRSAALSRTILSRIRQTNETWREAPPVKRRSR